MFFLSLPKDHHDEDQDEAYFHGIEAKGCIPNRTKMTSSVLPFLSVDAAFLIHEALGPRHESSLCNGLCTRVQVPGSSQLHSSGGCYSESNFADLAMVYLRFTDEHLRLEDLEKMRNSVDRCIPQLWVPFVCIFRHTDSKIHMNE